MKKVKNILLILMLSAMTIPVCAQKGRHDRIKALKIAFITERLSLTSKEAEKFWPIYNAYDANTHQLRNVEMRKIKSRLKQQETEAITEDEAQEMLDKISNIESRLFKERKKLITDLRKVISAKKIILLKKAEDDFNRELISRLRDRKKQYKKNR